jgi:hypothetical protein
VLLVKRGQVHFSMKPNKMPRAGRIKNLHITVSKSIIRPVKKSWSSTFDLPKSDGFHKVESMTVIRSTLLQDLVEEMLE